MEPAGKRARPAERPSAVTTRVVPFDPLQGEPPGSAPIVLSEVEFPKSGAERLLPYQWFSFKGRDGKHYRGTVPIAMFPIVGRYFEIYADTEPQVSRSGGQVHCIRRVREIKPRRLTVESINQLLADILRADVRDMAPPSAMEGLARCQESKWLTYFYECGQLPKVFLATEPRELALLEEGMPPVRLLTEAPMLYNAIPVDPAVVASHPYLCLLFAFLPLHRAGRMSVVDLVSGIADFRMLCTVEPATLKKLTSVLGTDPLRLFYFCEAPTFLGPLRMEALPLVCAQAAPDSYNTEAINTLRGYRAFVDALRAGPDYGFVCLPKDEADALLRSHGGDPDRLFGKQYLDFSTDPQTAATESLFTVNVYEHRLYQAQCSIAECMARLLPQAAVPAESHFAAAVDRLFGDSLHPQQADVLRRALTRGISVFAGLPFSGRTHLLAAYAALAVFGLGYHVAYVSPTEATTVVWVDRFLHFAGVLAANPLFAELRASCPATEGPDGKTSTIPDLATIDVASFVSRYSVNGFLRYGQQETSPRFKVVLFDSAASLGLLHLAHSLRRFHPVRKMVLAGNPLEAVPLGIGYPFAAIFEFLYGIGGIFPLTRVLDPREGARHPDESESARNLVALTKEPVGEVVVRGMDAFALDAHAWFEIPAPSDPAAQLEELMTALMAMKEGNRDELLEMVSVVALGFQSLDALNLVVYKTLFADVVAASGASASECFNGVLYVGERLVSTVTRRVNAATNSVVGTNDVFKVARLRTVTQLRLLEKNETLPPPFLPHTQRQIMLGKTEIAEAEDTPAFVFKEQPNAWNAAIATTSAGMDIPLCAFLPGCGSGARELKRAYVVTPESILGTRQHTVVLVVSAAYTPSSLRVFYAIAAAAAVNVVVIGPPNTLARLVGARLPHPSEARDYTLHRIQRACSILA